MASGLKCPKCDTLCHKSCMARSNTSNGFKCCLAPTTQQADVVDTATSIVCVSAITATTATSSVSVSTTVADCAPVTTDTSASKGAITRTTCAPTLQTTDAARTSVSDGACVDNNTLSTDIAVSKGAVLRTSRSASQTADTSSVVGGDSTSVSTEVLPRTSRSSTVRSASNSNVRSASFSKSSQQTNVKSAIKQSSLASKALDADTAKAKKSSTFGEVTVNDIISHANLANSMQPPNGLIGISLEQLSSLISSLMATELQSNNQDILQRIDNLSSQISVISQRTEQISQLSSQVSDIEARVSSLEEREDNAAVVSPPVNIDNLAGEIQDRIYRSRNLFIYGLSEECADSALDRQRIFDALSAISDIELAGLSVRRIPSRRADLPRPIIARLVNPDDVIRVLRSQRLLPPGLTARADHTVAERARFDLLREQVNQHNAALPNDRKRIKYVRGVPTIVPVRKPRDQEN